MSRLSCLFLPIALLLAVQYAACQVGPAPGDQAIDMTSSENVQLVVPYLRNVREPFPAEKLKFYLDSIEPILRYLIKVGDEVIGKRTNPLTWIKISAKLVTLVIKTAGRKVPPGMAVRDGNRFAADTLAMIQESLNKADQVAKEMADARVKRDVKQLRKDYHAFFQTLLEGIRSSKVAFFVDWRKGTMAGEQFPDHSSKLAGSLQYHGYGKLISITRNLLTIAKKFIPKSKH